MSAPVIARAPKGQLKCFQCRKLVPSKEGNWHSWAGQQVFLCKPCELETRGKPERK